ncbi:hypothetical protein Ddc_17189 [Ditylenchus destructor]|nr:hypothetical protein Ddc_17189 [Ditylenchus destructor]
MEKRQYAIILYLLYIQHLLSPAECTLDLNPRHKRAASANNLAPDAKPKTPKIPDETPEKSPIDSLIAFAENLTTILHSFNTAIHKDAIKDMKGFEKQVGFTEKFEMRFEKAGDLLGSMLKGYDTLMKVKGKMVARTAVRNVSKRILFKTNYLSSEQEDAIIDTALHVKWAEVVGKYLLKETQGYQKKLQDLKDRGNSGNQTTDTPQNLSKDQTKKLTDANGKLSAELEQFKNHMTFVQDLLNKVIHFFSVVAPTPEADPAKQPTQSKDQPRVRVTGLVSNNIFDYIPNEAELLTKLKEVFHPEGVRK